ncbi:hypothetical protein [Paraburkholderia ginsengiterrae]|uniref:hypothetical protein n=1 Tax=Paraburkholderia ginsengiterrae TaxID=1462993 RepID=UPI0013F4F068|nr:hypothetical protein [Paraburkholderia ginsengiterrae]
MSAARDLGMPRAAQRIVHAPARNQRFDSRDDREMFIGRRVFACLDLAAELVHIGKRLGLAVDNPASQ